MALEISISTVDDEDYDGVPVQVKKVIATIDGVKAPVSYSYDTTDEDAAIEAAVEADLIARGYEWEN